MEDEKSETFGCRAMWRWCRVQQATQNRKPGTVNPFHTASVEPGVPVTCHCSPAPVSPQGTDNVGHVAHLGGAATGAAFYWAWRRGLLRRWR